MPELKSEFQRILRALENRQPGTLSLSLMGEHCLRRFIPQERLVLLGGGTIAAALCPIAAALGFAVTVVDDRPSFANQERFPTATAVVCEDFSKAVESLSLGSSDYVAVMTRGHRFDDACLRAILGKSISPGYLGMVASRRRGIELKKLLISEGCDAAALERMHTPIGLNIGALTPQEIAISIAAELVQHRRSANSERDAALPCTDASLDLVRFVAENQEKQVLLLVKETHGSTPVKAGTMMALDEKQRICGSIGGGCAEYEALRQARALLKNGGEKALFVDMSGDFDQTEGMVCGGKMTVWMWAL